MSPTPTLAGNKFPGPFRLKRRRLIRPLFDRRSGDVEVITEGVVLIRYRLVPRKDVGLDVPLQIGFAPGSRMKTKVRRNRFRRVMREIFRHHKEELELLFSARQDCLTMMVLLRGKDETATEDLRRDFPKALNQLAARFTANP